MRRIISVLIPMIIVMNMVYFLSFTSYAAESNSNPLLQQLNSLTGNDSGYDMSYEDKVQVLRACWEASTTMQNYTFILHSIYENNFKTNDGKIIEKANRMTGITTFYFDRGSFFRDDYCIPDLYHKEAWHNYYAFTPESMYTSGGGGASRDQAYGFKNRYDLYNWDATSYYGYNLKFHECVVADRTSIEALAAIAEYKEIDGLPYLVCTFSPVDMKRDGYYLGGSLKSDPSQTFVTYTISLSNYGAFIYEVDMPIHANSVILSWRLYEDVTYTEHHKMQYCNVNTTVLPAIPEYFTKVF